MKPSVTDSLRLDLDWQAFMAEHDMEWVVKPTSWNEGAYIGNGTIGAMVYGAEHAKKRRTLRFVMGRTDVTATRTDRDDFKPRVPIGEMNLELAGLIYNPTRLRVDLWNAELRGLLTTTCGEVRIRVLVHAEETVMAIELETSEEEREARLEWVPHSEVDDVLKFADGINVNQYIPLAEHETSREDGVTIAIQRFAGGEECGEGCVTAWKVMQMLEGRRVAFVSIQNSSTDEARKNAVEAVRKAASADFGEWVSAHRRWWHGYYRQSFLSIPDRHLESFYWIQMYKLASAARADSVLLDNQGPWLAPTPWAGNWFNMNVQMSYSPVYASNRLAIGESMVQAVADNREHLRENVPLPYRHDSAGLGRSGSFDLRSETGEEIGNLTWLCHCLWRQYRYSMDDGLLRDVLYPVLRGSVNYYLHLLHAGEDGKLHLPPSISPEYGSFKRLTVSDCHYDLALLRWGCETLLAADARLGNGDPLAGRWREVLDNLTPLPVDESGYMVGRGVPLAFGHRHFSHLLAVFPLHLVSPDREEERELIARSLRHWLDSEGDLRGFSFTGAASIAATLGWGDAALRLLRTLLGLIKPNTMYKEAGPVIETPLAGAESLHDMLLQSWGGTIRIFPAVPEEWREAAFHDLRAEGAFLVSAVRRAGATSFVRVKSLAGEPCEIRTGWTGAVHWRLAGEAACHVVQVADSRESITLPLNAGDDAILYPAGEEPELRIGPASGKTGPVRYFGGSKPWRLHGFPFRNLLEEDRT
ncbi:glycosyl hydrolase family 95 catalytic domain-containing protein [Paenibacillus chitinolyticus]|uniref:glycosyl hydrolase family 95 catalytic domain-containing protein n=1 Tax=Paenibacillus chitinolyticus TaxID=79263 RepID=UPI003672D2A8